ncbi:hypothetical protein CK516_33180 [Nostoc sp. 'Peltigera malacea cyanobiont' DB3992]|nr:hypothetical protein CK516_33180 [Nostoc sp. 'Peltigera malacea cyanobiont' DB3992]
MKQEIILSSIFTFMCAFFSKSARKEILTIKKSIYEGMGNGDWGMGIGDWGLGTGDWGRSKGEEFSPLPLFNTQCPMPKLSLYFKSLL